MNNTAFTALSLDSLSSVTGGKAAKKDWTPASKTQTVEESSRQFVGGNGNGVKRFGSGTVKCDEQGCSYKFD
jgi:hypothetical protein